MNTPAPDFPDGLLPVDKVPDPPPALPATAKSKPDSYSVTGFWFNLATLCPPSTVGAMLFQARTDAMAAGQHGFAN
jgi:hypothetical protein